MSLNFLNKCVKCFKLNINHFCRSMVKTRRFEKEMIVTTLIGAMLMTSVIWDTDSVAYAYEAENNIENHPYAIMAGDEELAVVKTKMAAQEVVQHVKAKYGVTSASTLSIINPAITIEPKKPFIGERDIKPLSVDNATEYILDMNSGETPIFEVITAGKGLRTEKTEYKVKVVKTSKLYKGESRVVQEGKNGTYLVTGDQTLINGEVINEEIHDKELVKKPVTKIIEKGTKEKIVKGVATGKMIRPTGGRVSSGFGYRINPVYGGYEFHLGVDLAPGYGAAIKAADGGKVVHASYHPSYGNQIVIDHGNGYKTRYAHCASFNVSVGTKVAKGDLIARVGSTGDSTGPHLHFEVIKWGNRVNPLNYV